MGRKHGSSVVPEPTVLESANTLTAPSSVLDAALTSLFAASSGPVKFPATTSAKSSNLPSTTRHDKASLTQVEQEDDTQSPQSLTSEPSPDNPSTSRSESGSDDDPQPEPSRKRRRIAPTDDIEGQYMKRLAKEEVCDSRIAQREGVPADGTHAPAYQDSAESSDADEAGEMDQIPQHESLIGQQTDADDKSDRTVFLGNVSVEAIKSKTARKTLLRHLSSCLSGLQSDGTPHKIESLRFRSTAFASGAGPKRAAYAKRELMEETTHSTNAYVVYTSHKAAKKAAATLNGTMVLDRHLRVDLVAKPAEIDHRRCVFVGNLRFFDEQMVETETESGEKERKRKTRQPADAEEGLWRTFSTAGKVESVRVVRDKSTRVGKGIAYVQFHDENSVEAALLYNEKKFPPLLPRKLRVTRARKPKKIMKDVPREQGKGMGSRRGNQTKRIDGINKRSAVEGGRSDRSKRNANFVFEGYRATKPTTATARGAKKKRKYTGKPTTRSSRRGAAFKAAGGKPSRK